MPVAWGHAGDGGNGGDSVKGDGCGGGGEVGEVGKEGGGKGPKAWSNVFHLFECNFSITMRLTIVSCTKFRKIQKVPSEKYFIQKQMELAYFSQNHLIHRLIKMQKKLTAQCVFRYSEPPLLIR